MRGKAALVTGATSGIGLGLARAFAHQGASVMLHGLGKPEEGGQLRNSLAREAGVEVCAHAAIHLGGGDGSAGGVPLQRPRPVDHRCGHPGRWRLVRQIGWLRCARDNRCHRPAEIR